MTEPMNITRKKGRTPSVMSVLAVITLINIPFAHAAANIGKSDSRGLLYIFNDLIGVLHSGWGIGIHHYEKGTEGYDSYYDQRYGGPPFWDEDIFTKVVSIIPGYELAVDTRPINSLSAIDLELSLHSQYGTPITATNLKNELRCSSNPVDGEIRHFGVQPVTLWRRFPEAPGKFQFLADFREAFDKIVGGWGADQFQIPLPDLNGEYASQVPYDFLRLRFDVYAGDMDLDGNVGLEDYALFASSWREYRAAYPDGSAGEPGEFLGDITGLSGLPDGKVDFRDVEILARNWLERSVPPTQARNPNPPDGTINILPNARLSWAPGYYVDLHDVYFGTDSNAVTDANDSLPVGTSAYKGNQVEATFDPGIMALDTTYYWRIDEGNPFGTTTGSIWSFTTGSIPAPASAPDPPDGALGIQARPVLSWQAGVYATSHNVFFGTSDPPPFQRNQTGTTFSPGTLSERTTYYWRIDEVGEFGTSPGPVWTFTTGQLPEPPSNPDPPDGATDVWVSPILTWTGGAGAQSYDIYFGTMWDYRKRGNQTDTTFNPGTLSLSTQYYWRIAEISRWGTTYGPEWTFTTPPAK